jgi:hypothetical protein
LVVLSAGLAVVARLGAHQADPAELAKRCDESRPAWASYQEDIKGEVGAQPVARWRGRLVEVHQEAGTVTVTFHLESPWAGYEADVPILLRDPMGHEYRQDSVEKEGGTRRYIFRLDAQTGMSTLPWVEIHFPHTERRIALGAAGRWTNTEAAS